MGVIWSAFSSAATFRDNFLPLEYQRKFATAALFPKWGWKGWLLGILALGFIALLEGSYRTTQRRVREIVAADAKETALRQRSKEDLEEEVHSLQRRLQMPDIVPEIVTYDLEEIMHPPTLLMVSGIFGLLGDRDTLVKVTLHLNNHNRVKAAVQKCELVIWPGVTGEQRILADPVSEALDLGTPIEFGCPHSGWAHFVVKNTTIRGLIGKPFVVAVTDGVKNVRMSSEKRFV